MNTKAVRLHGKNDLRLDEITLPEVGPDDVQVKIICDSVCMSTYKRAILGENHKRVHDDVAEHPAIMGHEFAGEIVQVAAGLIFGPVKAFIYVILGCLIGQTLTFYLGKLLGRDFVKAFISQDKLEHYTGLLNSRKGYTVCFLLYLIPGIPKDFLCYIAGISGMDIKYFLLLSMLGRIPGLIGSIAMGSLIGEDRLVPAIIIFAAACVVAVLGVIYRDKIHTKLEEISEKI